MNIKKFLEDKIFKYFTKEYYKHFKIKSVENVKYFPAYKYWLGHVGIGLGIFSVVITLCSIFSIGLILSSWIAVCLVIIYVFIEEVIIQAKGKWFSNPDFLDSLTDINQHLVVIPLALIISSFYIIALIVLLFQFGFFYRTIDWTNQ